MRERTLGTGGPRVPVVGQGTWYMERDPDAAVSALRRGLDLGMRHVDTAEMYGSGRVEEIVGEAIRGRRDQVFLATKVLPEGASRHGTARACQASLRRLGTDHVDLYLLHWEGPHPLADTIAAFVDLVERGHVRAFGVSNFDEQRLADAVRIAGPGRIACNQVLYHLGERAVEHRVVPACAELGVALVAYSPFGQGSFPAPESPGGRVLAEIARERGATPRQVALAFLLRHEGSFAIPKAVGLDHVGENAGAGDVSLGEDEVARIDRAFPLGPWRGGVPVL